MTKFDVYTKLCSHFDGTDEAKTYTDPIVGTVTFYGTAQLDTTQKVFGASSLLLNGTTAYVTIPDSEDWNFGSGDFTIDFRYMFNSLSGLHPFYFRGITVNYTAVVFWYLNILHFIAYDNNSNILIEFSIPFTPSLATWYHLAIVRSGNTWEFYVDS